MISGKYTRQFYQFTEHSIAGIVDASEYVKQTSDRTCLYVAGLVLFLALITALVGIRPAARKDTPALSIRPALHIQSEPFYASKIPMFRVSAKRQLVSAMPLRKGKIVAFNEDELINEAWVVMDKVVVIPKVIS